MRRRLRHLGLRDPQPATASSSGPGGTQTLLLAQPQDEVVLATETRRASPQAPRAQRHVPRVREEEGVSPAVADGHRILRALQR